MRPGSGVDSNAADPARPRKCSTADPSTAMGDRDRSATQPTSFFLSRDPDAAIPRSQRSDRGSTSSFSDSPLSTLQDTIQEADRPHKRTCPSSTEAPIRSGSRRRSTIKPGTVERLLRRGSSNNSASAGSETAITSQSTSCESERTRAVTPSPLPSRDVSLPSSPQSLASRPSRSKLSTTSDDDLSMNADETGSQAVLSSGDEDEIEAHLQSSVAGLPRSSEAGIQDSQPELIMPSIKMPSRRPFTQRGKRLGRFKILVAGRKGRPLSHYHGCRLC
jgi:hypothetical protein